MTIKAIFFDLDGTLIDSVPDLLATANYVRSYYQLSPLSRELIETFIGDGVRNLASRTVAGCREFQFSESEIEAHFQLFKNYYQQHLLDYTTVYSGVPQLLATLQKNNIKMAVITNKLALSAEKILSDLELTHYFQVIYGGDTFVEKKPSALPLKNALKALNVEAYEAIMVGDSINDIISGQEAACHCCYVNYGYSKLEEILATKDVKPDSVIEQPLQLLSILEKLSTD